MRPTQEAVHQALDDLILNNPTDEMKSWIKELEKLAKDQNKSMYEIMELLTNDLQDKGVWKFN